MEFKSQTFTVSDLYNWHKAGELFLQPTFQRRKVWKPVAKSYLIDTVLRGLPMPKIYFRMQVDPKTIKSVREIVDGQQRLDAIFGYINDEFVVSKNHNPAAGGKQFSKLPEAIQSHILSYDISADLLIGADDPQVLQIFARINSYSVILNAQEKRNAKFFGVFKQAAYAAGSEHIEFWRRHKILTNQNIVRMGDAELASELMIGLMGGLQDKKASIDRYYDLYEDSFPHEKEIRKRFDRAVNWIGKNSESAIRGSIFSRRPIFYSLFMAVADAIYGIEKGKGPIKDFPQSNLSATQMKTLNTELLRVSEGVRSKEPPKGLINFARASASQTDNIQPRRTRHNYLFGVLEKL